AIPQYTSSRTGLSSAQVHLLLYQEGLESTKIRMRQACGDSLCVNSVLKGIKKAFLMEQQKITVKLLRAQAESES
ncbi:hypothetical protein J0S82_007215, partial [Galemys pyrenaicus]